MSILIRKATKDDIPDLARIHLASKKVAYHGIVDQNFLNQKTEQEYHDKWTNWLSEEGMNVSLVSTEDQSVGFISYGRMQTPPPGTSKIRPQFTAEIFAIHIHPEVWRSGMGKETFQYAASELLHDKHHALCLWVLAKNERAIKFYDYLGGQRLGKRDIEIGPNKVKELCYGWRDIKEVLDK